MKMNLSFLRNKKKLIQEYHKLKESVEQASELFLQIENLKKYALNCGVNEEQVQQKSFLRTFYLLLKYDRDIYLLKLKRVSVEESQQLVSLIETYTIALKELEDLINKEDMINYQITRMKKIEKKVPIDEIILSLQKEK